MMSSLDSPGTGGLERPDDPEPAAATAMDLAAPGADGDDGDISSSKKDCEDSAAGLPGAEEVEAIATVGSQEQYERLHDQLSQQEPPPQALPLHWTKLGAQQPLAPEAPSGAPEQVATAARYPQDVVDIDPDELELVVVGTAGQKITAMGERLSELMHPQLESLVLRSHLIRSIQGIQDLTSLELLELYDNQVASLDGLALVQAHTEKGVSMNMTQEACPSADGRAADFGAHVPPLDQDDDTQVETGAVTTSSSTVAFSLLAPRHKLRVLDMSYNVIRDMSPIEYCPNLQELYLANNKLKALSGLSHLSQLKKLDMGANRIRVMNPVQLGGLVSLEELWLGKNKIEAIDGLDNLRKLRKLDVQSNRLTRVENLTSQCESLEELYLAHNGIDSEGCRCPTGLSQTFPNLTVLDLSRNRIDTTQPFSHLLALEELWLSGNSVASFDEVRPISLLPALETIYLEHNPLQASEPLYRKALASILPTLKQIDANLISPHEAAAAAAAASGASAPVSSSSTTSSSSLLATPAQLQDAILQRALAETEEARSRQQQEPPPQDPS